MTKKISNKEKQKKQLIEIVQNLDIKLNTYYVFCSNKIKIKEFHWGKIFYQPNNGNWIIETNNNKYLNFSIKPLFNVFYGNSKHYLSIEGTDNSPHQLVPRYIMLDLIDFFSNVSSEDIHREGLYSENVEELPFLIIGINQDKFLNKAKEIKDVIWIDDYSYLLKRNLNETDFSLYFKTDYLDIIINITGKNYNITLKKYYISKDEDNIYSLVSGYFKKIFSIVEG